MKEKIHPKYYPDARVVCSCGNTWTAGSTQPELRTDVCSKCHPFFTGEQRIVDAAGRVERFVRRLEVRGRVLADAEERRARASSPQLSISELGVGSRVEGVLAGAGVKTVQDVLDRLTQGDHVLTDLRGFGLKSLADLKKQLRSRGFELPSAPAPQPAVASATATAAAAE